MGKWTVYVAISGLILISSFFVIIQYRVYSIGYSETEIGRQLLQWYNENNKDEIDKPLLLEIFAIEDTNTVVATFLHKDEQIGALILKKGLNQQLKLENVLHGQAFYSELIETNKGAYALFIGENKQLSIQTIQTDMLQNKNLEVHIPPQRYFTKYVKIEEKMKASSEPVFYYRTLRGAIDAVSPESHNMDIIFVDEVNQTFLLHLIEESNLISTVGGFERREEGFAISSLKKTVSYSMEGEKHFCYEEKKVYSGNRELTYLHGLIPNAEKVDKVVVEIMIKEELIYQASSNVINNQFLLFVDMPKQLQNKEQVKKFHLYDKEGKYLGTEMKL